MTIEEIKAYFAERGGKKSVKSSDPIWNVLIKLYNTKNKGKRGYSPLSNSCGSCRSTAYKWLIAQ